MPHIDCAIKLGTLSASHIAILEVVERHPDNMWTSSYPDLRELAMWATCPGEEEAPSNFEYDPESLSPESLDIVRNYGPTYHGKRHFTVYLGSNRAIYSPETIKNILGLLAEWHMIWSFGVYKKRYFASNKSGPSVETWLSKLTPNERERAAVTDPWVPLKPPRYDPERRST